MLAAMADNPFAPPSADLDIPVERGPVPRRVKVAVAMIAVTFTLGLLTNIAAWTGAVPLAGQQTGGPSQILSGSATFLLYMALTWKIYQGRNWARWIFTVLVGIGLAGLLITIAFAPTMWRELPKIFWVSSAVQLGIEVVAAAMLFTGDAARWFRAA